MAKTYEELLEQAAVIRDETKTNANTAKRVGGTIADIVERISEIEITGGGAGANEEILNRISEVETRAAAANTNASNALTTARSATLTAAEAKNAAVEANTVADEAKATATEANTKADQLANFNQDTIIPSLAQLMKGGEEVVWDGAKHINSFVESQNYYIHGERTNAKDGLPILNADPGHTIFAQLSVLDSSLTNGTGAKTDICVTQVLRLSNRTGGDGHIYVRTGQAATKEELTATDSTKWGTWEKLMGVFEKNSVSSAESLDGYTTNGMYSGMFVFSNSPSGTVGGVNIESGSTFLLIVVNGYAVGSVGLTPQATQLLYLLPSGGIGQGSVRPANMYVRTAIFNKSAKIYDWGNFDRFSTASEAENVNTIVEDFEALKVEFEKVKNSIGVNIYGSVRVSGVSDPQLTFRRYIADGAAGNPLDVIHPCLVEKGTGRLLHILQNLNFEKDIHGNPRKIDGSEGEVYITNTEPIYHITGHVYVNGVSYDVFLRSLYPFFWQGKEAERIEPFGLSPDNCVAHQDTDGVTRMHSVYNPEWAGSYYAMNGFVGKFVYEGIGDAMTETYDESGALFEGKEGHPREGGLASVAISLTNGEQYAMNMNEDTTKTVPFFNEHAYALELFIGHMLAEGGTYDAHNAALMGSGFTANDSVTTAAHFNADNEPAVNGARYLGGDDKTTRYVGNASYGQWYADGVKKNLHDMLTSWTSPWKIMERQRVMAYAIENNIPELTWFAFEGNKYKWRSVSGFAGPNDGVMTCVVFKVFSTKFAANMVDPTGGASLEGHRIDFMITGAMYRGWSTDVSPSRWDSGLIFTTDNTGLYKAYIQRDQSNMIKSVNADANEDTVLPFEESYEYIGSVQGIQRNYRRDFSDGSLFHAKSTELSKGAALHTCIGAHNWYDSQTSAAGMRSVRGFRRGYGASAAHLSPCALYANIAPSYAITDIGFGTCVQLASET